MNNKYTLKELVKVYEETYYQTGRDAGIKAVLDFIGYDLPKDAEREAFDAWCNANHKLATTDQFEAWKAGREELRRAINKPSYSTPEQIDKSIQNLTTKEPDWIPWLGGDKSPIVGNKTQYEVKYRDGTKLICTTNDFPRWRHRGTFMDIIAYRIL